MKIHRYDQAADALRREIGINQQTESYGHIGRLAVVLVMVQLARGDQVAAEKAFKEWGNCCDPQEVQTLEMLLQAYDDEDPETAQMALNSPFIKHMDVEYAKLARQIPLPQGILSSSKTSVVKNAAPTYMSPNADVRYIYVYTYYYIVNKVTMSYVIHIMCLPFLFSYLTRRLLVVIT